LIVLIDLFLLVNIAGNSYSSDFRSLHSKVVRYPALVKHACSVDLYRPWSYDAYVKIAEVWLQDQRPKVGLD
jgi:hypothetical protein